MSTNACYLPGALHPGLILQEGGFLQVLEQTSRLPDGPGGRALSLSLKCKYICLAQLSCHGLLRLVYSLMPNLMNMHVTSFAAITHWTRTLVAAAAAATAVVAVAAAPLIKHNLSYRHVMVMFLQNFRGFSCSNKSSKSCSFKV